MLIVAIFSISCFYGLVDFSINPISGSILFCVFFAGILQAFWMIYKSIQMLNKEFIIHFQENRVDINLPWSSYSLNYSQIGDVNEIIKDGKNAKESCLLITIYGPTVLEDNTEISIFSSTHESTTLNLIEIFKDRIKKE